MNHWAGAHLNLSDFFPGSMTLAISYSLPMKNLVPASVTAIPIATMVPNIQCWVLAGHTHSVAISDIQHPASMWAILSQTGWRKGFNVELNAVPRILCMGCPVYRHCTLFSFFVIFGCSNKGRDMQIATFNALVREIFQTSSLLL